MRPYVVEELEARMTHERPDSIFSVGFSPHNSHSLLGSKAAASVDNGRPSARGLKPEAPVHHQAPFSS